jgi:hypothetical protein
MAAGSERVPASSVPGFALRGRSERMGRDLSVVMGPVRAPCPDLSSESAETHDARKINEYLDREIL